MIEFVFLRFIRHLRRVAQRQNEKPKELCAATSPTGRSKERNDDVPPKQHSCLNAQEVTGAIQGRLKIIMKRCDQ
jgi:hypothetical protein